jgi:hypothetical protein
MRLSASISHPPSLPTLAVTCGLLVAPHSPFTIHHSAGRCRQLGPSNAENHSGRPVLSSAAAANDPQRLDDLFLINSRLGSMSFRVELAAGRRRQPRCSATRAAVLPALRARSRAGEARRSVPLRASETPIRSRAWGWLRLFAASARARPAARTSPPSGAGLGVGAPAGLGRGIRLTGVGSTRNDLNPPIDLREQCCAGKYLVRTIQREPFVAPILPSRPCVCVKHRHAYSGL